MSKPPLQKALIPPKPGLTPLPPTSGPSSAPPAPEGASLARGFYFSTSGAAQAAGTSPAPPGAFARPGTCNNTCPPSPVGSNISIGSTPVPEGTFTPSSANPMVKDPPPPTSEYPDGVGFKTTLNVTFKGSSDAADTDFRVADIAINWIADLLNWIVSKSRPIQPTQADPLCTSLFTLVHNLSDLGILKDYATYDELSVQSSELGAVVSDLVTISSVVAFTPAPEEVESTCGPLAPKGKKNKGKDKAPAPPPPAPPHPPCSPVHPLPIKLAAAREAMGMSWVPVTNKWKTSLLQEEVLVKLAKTFPATTTIALQQASSTVMGHQTPTPSEARRKHQKKFTTQGRSHKSVSVYLSPSFTWKEDIIYNQINSCLGNAKWSIHVTGIKLSRGTLSLSMDAVPNTDDLAVFSKLFQDVVTEKSPNMVLKVKVPTSKSSIKINDFPFFGLIPQHNEKGQLVPLTADQLISILKASPFGKDFSFYENSGPHLTRNSPRSDTGTFWFNINDSHIGLIMRNLVSHAFMYGKHCLAVAPTTKHVGVPQCNRCWRYGHPSNAWVCLLKGKLCPICREPHSVEYYRHLASCCCGKPKQTPPIPATSEGDPCPHDAKCINCREKHYADDRICSFWKSRFKSDWIWHRYI